jgi:hypothetical protein
MSAPCWPDPPPPPLGHASSQTPPPFLLSLRSKAVSAPAWDFFLPSSIFPAKALPSLPSSFCNKSPPPLLAHGSSEGGGGGALSAGLLRARREGKEGWGRRGVAGAPFYRARGGAGWPDGEGNQAAGGGAPLLAIQFSGEGKRSGEWG